MGHNLGSLVKKCHSALQRSHYPTYSYIMVDALPKQREAYKPVAGFALQKGAKETDGLRKYHYLKLAVRLPNITSEFVS